MDEPLAKLAEQSHWVAIEYPNEDDPDTVLGYYDGSKISVAGERRINYSGVRSYYSGNYDILVSDSTGTRFVFVLRAARQSASDPPRTEVSVTDSALHVPIPDTVSKSHDFIKGSKIGFTLDFQLNTAVFRFFSSADHGTSTVRVIESPESDATEYTIEIGSTTRDALSLNTNNSGFNAQWIDKGRHGVEVPTSIYYDQPLLGSSSFGATKPIRVSNDTVVSSAQSAATPTTQTTNDYQVTVPPSHPLAPFFESVDGLSFGIRPVNGSPGVIGSPSRNTSGQLESEVTYNDRVGASFTLPPLIARHLGIEESGNLLLATDGGEVYGVPTTDSPDSG